jgi:hypothetical protein
VQRRRALSLLCIAGLIVYGAALCWLRIGSGDVEDYGFASGDVFLYFYPSYDELYARVRAGVLPRWNPWQLFGTPWLATLQAGLYYPGHVAYLLLPTHIAMAVSGVAHLLLAAVGVYVFLSRAGLGHLAASAGALVFAFRGYFLTCLSGPNLEEAAAWIGVGAAAALATAARPSLRATAVLAIAAAMSLLAGGPQHTAYLLYAWAALWLAWTVASRRPPAEALRSGACFAAAMLLAALLGAAQILPTAEVMAAGTRSSSTLPANVLSPIGNPAVTILSRFPIVGLPHSFGTAPLVLAALAALGGRHVALLLWAEILGIVTAVFALGTSTPWFWIYRALPGLGMFRGPERVLLLTDFAVAVAAAIAVDGLVRGPDPATPPRRRAILAALSLGAAAAALAVAARHDVPGALVVAACVVVGACAWRFVAGTRVAVVVGAVVLIAVGAEIFFRTHLKMVFPYTAEKVQWAQRHDPTYRFLALGARHDRLWLWSTLDPQFASKQATRHRLRSIEDYEPMNLTRQNRYLTYFGRGAVTDFVNGMPFIGYVPGGLGPAPNGSSPGVRRRLLDLGAVGRIVMPANAAGQPRTAAFLSAAGLSGIQSLGPMALVANPDAAPRAFVVYRTAAAPPEEELLRRLADPGFDPLALAYVEGDPGFAAAPDAPPRGSAARFVEDGEDVVEVAVDAAAPALLVLADTYASGWSATVDGVAAPIVAANFLFRGVPVPAGTHRVRFVYRPWTIPAGQVSSVVGLVVLALLWRRPAPTS